MQISLKRHHKLILAALGLFLVMSLFVVAARSNDQALGAAAPTISSINPSGTINSSSAAISVYYSDNSGSGIDSASVDVYDTTGVGAQDLTANCVITQSYASCPRSGLTQGTNTISVSLQDNQGDVATGSGSFFVDSIQPFINSLAPRGSINTQTPTVTFTLSDGAMRAGWGYYPAGVFDSGVNTSTLNVKIDGSTDITSGCTITPQAPDDDNAYYAVSCPVTTPLVNGPHTVTASVADNAGNSGGNGTLTRDFSVDTGTPDTTAPSVWLFKPSDMFGNVTTTSTTAMVMYGDANSGVNTSTVQLSLDGNPLSGCTVSTSKDSCPISGLIPGTHTLSASVTDNAGNTGTGNATFQVDTAPTIDAIKPSGTINTTDAAISVYYSDNSGAGIDSASVDVYDTTNLGNLDLTSSCVVTQSYASCPRSGLTQGTNSISVSLKDNLGEATTGNGSFFVDSIAPFANSLKPMGSVNSQTPTFTFTLSDGAMRAGWGYHPPWVYDTGVNTSTMKVKVDGNDITSTCNITPQAYDDDNAYLAVACPQSNPIANGNHDLNVTVSDWAGNTGSFDRLFTVDTGTPDTTGPSIWMYKPTGTISTSSTNVAMYFSDANSGVNTSTAQLSLNGHALSGCTVSYNSHGFYIDSCPVSGLTPGNYTIGASVADNAGNVSTGSSAFTAAGPSLALGLSKVYWGSVQDYDNHQLSVDYKITEVSGTAGATGVSIVGSSSTNGVTCSSTLPLSVGDIAAGGSATVTLTYNIPGDVTAFRTSTSGTTSDGWAFPGTYGS